MPKANGSYKFVITRLPEERFLEENGRSLKPDFATNDIIFIATEDNRHATIVSKLGLNESFGDLYTFGGAHISVDHDAKILEVFADSDSYGSCSNELVLRMLEEVC